MKFTVILSPDDEDGGFVAECPAIPGCVSEGDSIDEALRNIQEAIEGCLEAMNARNESLPRDGQLIVATVDAEVPTLVP
jgi:predicted RNase H-like HicB family nuclease